MKISMIWIAVLALAGACKGDGDKAAAPASGEGPGPLASGGGAAEPVAADEPAPDPAAGEPAEIEKLSFDKGSVPRGIEIDGELDTGLRFRDKNGDNWVLVSYKEPKSKQVGASRYLYVKHVAVDGGETRELRVVRDKVEDCEYDMLVQVHPESLEVTDLDGDGAGEVTFGYKLACRSDMSPATFKLLVLEDGDKYILRGDTKIGSDAVGFDGGNYKVDPSFKKGPPEFLEHAKKRWPSLVLEG
jgi:hypothetical protein